jgi:hypothetical protein
MTRALLELERQLTKLKEEGLLPALIDEGADYPVRRRQGRRATPDTMRQAGIQK